MNKRERKIITVFIVVFVIICISTLILFINKGNIVRKVDFDKPTIETNFIKGIPDNIDSSLTYKEMAVKDDYIVYLCSTPKVNKNMLTIYFTSSEKNKDLLKIKIFDKDEKVLSESGLINPNSYIKEIKLNRELLNNEMVTIKVMSYEKETYYSNGSFKLNVFVHKD